MFFVMSGNLSMHDYMFSSAKKFMYILAPPLPLGSSSSELPEGAVSQAIVLRKFSE